MSTTAAAALALSAAANAQAQAARTQACIAIERSFKPEGATVAEMRNYADCVYRLHPNEMTESQVLAVKGAILILFAAVIVGCVVGWRDSYSARWEGAAIGGFSGLAVAAVGMAVVVAAWAGVAFLLS